MANANSFRAIPLNDPDTIHMVLLDHGKFGRAWRETEPTLTDGQLAALIEECQIDERIVRILAVNAKAGTCADVTAQIGALVFYAADSEDAGFDHFTDAMSELCALAGFDIDAEQEAWQARKDCESRAWERQRRSLTPSIASHI